MTKKLYNYRELIEGATAPIATLDSVTQYYLNILNWTANETISQLHLSTARQ